MANSFLKFLKGKLVNKNGVTVIDEDGVIKEGIGHFKTNFSVDQKESDEISEYNQQQTFHMMNYETRFDSVDQDKTFLHTVEYFMIFPDSEEVSYSGSWSDDSTGGAGNLRFGYSKLSSTIGDTAIFSFSGTGCDVYLFSTSTATHGIFSAEISYDGGITWVNKKSYSTQSDSATHYNQGYQLYSGLDYGDYKVKITVVYDNVFITSFGYSTHCVQKPATQKYIQATASKTINDVPPGTFLFTGSGWTLDETTIWNRFDVYTANATDYFEFKFFGSKAWLQSYFVAADNTDLSITIDGSTTNVINSSFNTDVPASTLVNQAWLRIDNGSLSEGWHTIKVTVSTVTAGNYRISGISFYSGDTSTDTTFKRSMICGKNSYAVDVHDSGWDYTSTGTGTFTNEASPRSFHYRRIKTTNNGDNALYSIPNNSNIKAIYLMANADTTCGDISVQLDGSDTRYLNLDTGSINMPNQIFLLYDKSLDGNLHNKTLKITKDSGTNMYIEGIVFEIGDAVEGKYIWCMPKFTRYNDSAANLEETPVSITQRLDVYGVKSDLREGRKPVIHSGWLDGNTNVFFRHGLCYGDVFDALAIMRATNQPTGAGYQYDSATVTAAVGISIPYVSHLNESGLGYVVRNDFTWQKAIIHLARVI